MPPANPAVGILREHVILGFFASEFGAENVIVPERGNERSYDVILCGGELSIKTLTNDTGFKILWTVDTDQVRHEMSSGYQPQHDILLINIFWGQCKDSVFYIPLSVQENTIKQLGRHGYLSSATGTNNRGIEIKKSAVTVLKAHPETDCIQVNWDTPDIKYPEPWDEWNKYWSNL